MGSGVRVERSEDLRLIRDLVLTCWDTIAEDGQNAKDYFPNPSREAYLVAFVGDEPAGVLTISSANASILHVHIHVDPSQREQKYEIGQALIDYIKGNTEFRSMVVYIPTIYPNVSGFAKRLGFVNVGTAADGFLKNGELHDLEILQRKIED